jgi:hypothetical protein
MKAETLTLTLKAKKMRRKRKSRMRRNKLDTNHQLKILWLVPQGFNLQKSINRLLLLAVNQNNPKLNSLKQKNDAL